MIRKRPFGTAEKEVLLKLTHPARRSPQWSTSDAGLYDGNRELTERVLQGLNGHGYVSMVFESGQTIYTVTDTGRQKAEELRSLWYV